MTAELAARVTAARAALGDFRRDADSGDARWAGWAYRLAAELGALLEVLGEQPDRRERPMTESWLPVPGWEGYEVSDLGRVRSVDRTLPNGQFCAGTVLRQSPDSHGYMRVTLRDGRRTATRRVHELVMLAHAGPRSAGMHILHRNDDQHRNDRNSLRYGTQSENEKEKNRREGRRRRKEKRKKAGKGSPRDTSPGSRASPRSQP